MKILVLGVYYARNLGDAVICDCAAAQLRVHFPDAEILVRDIRSRSAFLPESEPDMKTMKRRRFRAALRNAATRFFFLDKEYDHHAYRLSQDTNYIDSLCRDHFDLVVFAGGQLFQDGFALQISRFVSHFEKSGTPVFFNACGTGPAVSPKIRKELSRALASPCVKLISTRDNADLIARKYLSGSAQAICVSDPGLFAAETYGIEKNADSDVIGLGIMHAASIDLDSQSRFWAALIRTLEQKSIRWKLFVNGSAADVAYARHVFAQVPGVNRTFEECFAALPENPEDLVRCIAQFHSLISFRLHSHVIAASLGIPSVALVWDEKLRFFFRQLGHPERCLTVKDTPAAVLSRLADAQSEGYDVPALELQKKNSMAVLFDAMEAEIKKKESL